MGLLQYITPLLQFLVGVYVRHEPLPTSELVGFLLVWLALLILCASQFGHWKLNRRLESAPVGDHAVGNDQTTDPSTVTA
jgi:chloramphenicol-sensitive protein RarD